jgi:predicted protein tyrosine phosphatase
MLHALFVCSQNRLRSPTAESVFADWPGVETASAGTNNDAMNPLGVDIIGWADIIFVMEQVHRRKVADKYQEHLRNKKIVCLNIPDNYEYLDPELVKVLMTVVPKHLPPRNKIG